MKAPTTQQLKQLEALLKWSNKYEISIQFWPSQTVCFIAKDGVDLESWGGEFDFAIGTALEYLNRINKSIKNATNKREKS